MQAAMRAPTLIICSSSCFMLKSKVLVGLSLRPSFTCSVQPQILLSVCGPSALLHSFAPW